MRSEAFVKEQQAKKMLYRGAFSVGNPSGGLFFNPFDFTVKGIANTSVLYWGGKLLALYEVRPPMSTPAHALHAHACMHPASYPGVDCHLHHPDVNATLCFSLVETCMHSLETNIFFCTWDGLSMWIMRSVLGSEHAAHGAINH